MLVATFVPCFVFIDIIGLSSHMLTATDSLRNELSGDYIQVEKKGFHDKKNSHIAKKCCLQILSLSLFVA